MVLQTAAVQRRPSIIVAVDPRVHVPAAVDPRVHVPAAVDPRAHIPAAVDPRVYVPAAVDPRVHLPGAANPHAYVPALDGLRAVSIVIVVLAHCGLDRLLPGAFGVTLFFFISGLLITRQLLAALCSAGTIGLGRFYLRRALRLLPAGLLYVAIAGALFAAAGGHITWAGWLCAAFYGANVYDLWAGYRSTLPGVRHPFNILWSLAIEEHFYLAWPILLGWLWRRRAALGAALALCAAMLAWRLALYDRCMAPHPVTALAAGPWRGLCGMAQDNPLWRFKRLYIGTDTRADSILWGAILACLEARPLIRPTHIPAKLLPIAAAAVLLAASLLIQAPLVREVLRTSLQGAALLILVPACLDRDHALRRLLSSAPFLLVGQLSYSLYLWHWGAFAACDWAMPGNLRFRVLAGLPLAALLAACSYRFVETPMLRLRRRAGSAAAQHSPVAAA